MKSKILIDLEKWWLGLTEEEAVSNFKDLKSTRHEIYLRVSLAACSKKAWDKYARIDAANG